MIKKGILCVAIIALCSMLLIVPQPAFSQDSDVPLQETLDYIKQNIEESAGDKAYPQYDFPATKYQVALDGGCKITVKIIYGDRNYYQRIQLADLDPKLVKVIRGEIGSDSVPLLMLANSPGKKTFSGDKDSAGPKSVFYIYFRDREEMARRVAKAFSHAIKLCGGKSDPFQE